MGTWFNSIWMHCSISINDAQAVWGHVSEDLIILERYFDSKYEIRKQIHFSVGACLLDLVINQQCEPTEILAEQHCKTYGSLINH